MKTERKGLQSTKSNVTTSIQESLDFFPPSDRPNVKTNQVCHALVDRISLTTSYIDITGLFLKRSSSGNQHVLVGYHYDGNYIHGTLIKVGKDK